MLNALVSYEMISSNNRKVCYCLEAMYSWCARQSYTFIAEHCCLLLFSVSLYMYVHMYVHMFKCLQTQLPLSYSCPTPFPIPNSSCSAPLRMQLTAFSTTPRATWMTSALTRWPSLAMPWHRLKERIVAMLLPC